MAQPEFIQPDFMNHNSEKEIHERMMENLPDDIDDMPGGFPYDFTMPAAIEKSEFINYHMARALMIAFPQYAWDDWLDLHGQQVHLPRQKAAYASGYIQISGTVGAEISAGTVFCTPATEDSPSLEFATEKDCKIGEDGTVQVAVTAMIAGTKSNVAANTICMMAKPDKNLSSITNPESITGGAEREKNDDYYDRIAAEYDNSRTYLGNDSDYIRWAKEAGAGDCIVVSAYDGLGTVKLVLVDRNGQPANEALIEAVYRYIVSPDNRSARLLPTACAKLTCVAAVTVKIDYVCSGLFLKDTTSMEQVKTDFKEAVMAIYDKAKMDGMLRYNDVRPLLSAISGVKDFTVFTINGGLSNIQLSEEEYPETGSLDFTEAE